MTRDCAPAIRALDRRDGVRGNLRADYSGTDADGDSIGDAPYLVLPIGIDDRPLMVPP